MFACVPGPVIDMLKEKGWNHCGLCQDDIEWSEITEQDQARWFQACEASGLPKSTLLIGAVDSRQHHPGRSAASLGKREGERFRLCQE